MTTPAENRAKEWPNAVAVMTTALQALGHERFCPEGLTAFKQSIYDWGWKGTAEKVDIEVVQLQRAYNEVMDSLRAMFGPVDNDH